MSLFTLKEIKCQEVHVYKVFAVDEWTLMLCRVYLWRHGRPHQFTPISKKLPLPTRLRRCHNLYTACWKYCFYVSMYPINCISIINQTQRLTIIRTIECSYKLGYCHQFQTPPQNTINIKIWYTVVHKRVKS